MTEPGRKSPPNAGGFVLPDGVVVQEIQGESVLLQLASGHYYSLDAVGTRMLQALLAAPSLADACDRLLGEYDAEPERLRRDLEGLADQLLEQGLLLARPV